MTSFPQKCPQVDLQNKIMFPVISGIAISGTGDTESVTDAKEDGFVFIIL